MGLKNLAPATDEMPVPRMILTIKLITGIQSEAINEFGTSLKAIRKNKNTLVKQEDEIIIYRTNRTAII
jgi:hypothetical protein